MLLKKIFILNYTNKYTYQLISGFIPFTKRARLIPKQLGKMIIEDKIIEQEKKILIKILYNRKAILI